MNFQTSPTSLTRSLFVTITTLSVLDLCGCGGEQTGLTTFTPSNEIDKKANCPPTRADLIGERVDQILKSGVITEIEKQITNANTDKKELKPVKVKIFWVSLEELTKELKEDERKDLDAKKLFDKFDAYTTHRIRPRRAR